MGIVSFCPNGHRTKLKDRYVLRAAIGNLYTTEVHLKKMWKIVQEKMGLVLSEMET